MRLELQKLKTDNNSVIDDGSPISNTTAVLMKGYTQSAVSMLGSDDDSSPTSVLMNMKSNNINLNHQSGIYDVNPSSASMNRPKIEKPKIKVENRGNDSSTHK